MERFLKTFLEYVLIYLLKVIITNQGYVEYKNPHMKIIEYVQK